MALGGRAVSGTMQLDARTDNSTASANLHFGNVDFAAFFRGSRYFDTARGKLQGRVVLVSTGGWLAQVLNSAKGDVAMATTGGSISGLLVDVARLDIFSLPCFSTSLATIAFRFGAPWAGWISR
jgi:AsmA family protein